ncbi:hypothetical protein D3C71_2127160 [compost metagenome]
MLQSHDALAVAELQSRQARIQRALLDQLAVRTHRHQAALVDDRDTVGMLHGSQTMGDH